MKYLNLQNISQNRLTLGLIFLVILLLVGGFFAYQKLVIEKNQLPPEEVDLNFDPEGPYALLSPRRDGNALILNLKRTSSYDAITYELAYSSLKDEVVAGEDPKLKKKNTQPKTDEGDSGSAGGYIDRGVQGTIDANQKKGEYEQEILFGTCSKNVCKYDKGVENGTLTLHIRKGDKAYRMVTQWHLQKPDVALGILTSGDEHFIYKTGAKREDLTITGFVITNDLTGLPKLPENKQVMGKVYSLNPPVAKSLPIGEVTVELAKNASSDAKIFRFDETQNKWQELDTKISGSKLTANSDGAGIFAVLIPKK